MNTLDTFAIERIHILDGSGPTKAFCDLRLMDSFIIKGLRIVEGKDGLFVSMPRESNKEGKWYDTFLPLSVEIRKALQDMVLREYKNRERPRQRKNS